jgi:hypothetical protein
MNYDFFLSKTQEIIDAMEGTINNENVYLFPLILELLEEEVI